MSPLELENTVLNRNARQDDSRHLHRFAGSSTILVGTVVLAIFCPAAKADYLYGVVDGGDHQSQLLKIDPATGATVSLGRPGFESLEDIVVAPNGTLLAEGYENQFPPTEPIGHQALWSIDVSGPTPVATRIGVDQTYRFIEGMAYVGNTLYASASNNNSYALDTSDHLVTINPATGQATEVGLFGPQFLNVESIAYSPIYGLIGVDIGTLDPNADPKFSTYHTTPALIRIDPFAADKSQLATKIADLPSDPSNLISFGGFMSPYGPYVCGLRFGPDGRTLYGTTWPTHFGGESDLVTVDMNTGNLTVIGALGVQNVDGIAYISTAVVPEPSSALLLGAGVGLLGLIATFRESLNRSRPS